MPPNPPNKAHGFAMRSMSLRDMQISKSGKKILAPPPAKSWGRPCVYVESCLKFQLVNVLNDTDKSILQMIENQTHSYTSLSNNVTGSFINKYKRTL